MISMSKIAVLLTDMFEDVEYTKPAEAYTKAGHQLTHIGLKEGEIVKGKKQGTEVTIDNSVTNAQVEEYDALLIPGGYSPDKLRAHPGPVNFVQKFMSTNKPIFTICHAPQLLITANVLENRTLTGWKSIIQDIKNAGAEFVDDEVVEDNNLISSRGPQDITAFINATLKKLE